MKPIILTLGEEDLVHFVKNAGFEVCDANAPNSYYSAILIDTRENYKTKAIEVIKHVRKHENSRILVFAFTDENIDVLEYENLFTMGFDGCFDPSTPIELVKTRLGSSLRIKNMQDEAKIRFVTLKAIDSDTFEYAPKNPKPIRVLIYGRPGPQSLEITALLENLNINYVAAMTSFMAFEYLHRGQFDGVIMLGDDDSKGAIAFISGLRRNSRLYHLPCTVFINQDFGDTAQVLKLGASDINFFGLNSELAIARFLTLIDEQRRRESLNIAFAMTKTVKVADTLTGLYNRDFFFAHLKALLKQISADSQNLAIGFIEVKRPDGITEESYRKIITQTGSMISRLVRTEDTAARLENGFFAILCPVTSEFECKVALHRISAVLETSAYDAGDKKPVSITTRNTTYALAPTHEIHEIMHLFDTFKLG